MNTSTKNIIPVILQFGKKELMDTNIFDYSDKYNHSLDILSEGKYWMGSKTTNTRCNKLTLIGADKTHADDTKDK